MKNSIYIVLICLFIYISNTNAQGKKTIPNIGDTFTYEQLNVLEEESGNLEITGVKATKSTSSSMSVRSTGAGVGETLGELSVSLTGGAKYNIPIAVPPGINGVIPEVSVSYDSQSGNGLAGYGWNVSGVSVISRIPSTNFHDGEIDGIDYDNMDRFALDGQRLVLKSGTYGGNGAQYETEDFSNLKITSHGTSYFGSNYGPSYFMVHFPDGSKAKYGGNFDKITHVSYAIAYWENPQGVRISYQYLKSNNSLSIFKIKYGSMNANTPINEIQFNYTTSGRERWEQSYINNVSFERRNLLKNIEVYSEGVRYRKYAFTHNTTPLGYDRLTSATEYSGDATASHSSISFDYDTTSSSVNYNGLTTDLGLINIEQRNAKTVSLDLTGNGKMDFLVYPNTKNKFWVFKDIQSSGTNYPWLVNSGTFEAIFPTTALSYQNKVLSGQGLTVVQNSTGNQVQLKVYSKAPPSSGAPISYNYTKTWNSPMITTSIKKPHDYISGDFDGDGLTDVLAVGRRYTHNSTTVNYKNVYFINLDRNITSGFSNLAGSLQLQVGQNDKLHAGDFNGDGKTDLLHVAAGKLYVYGLNSNNTISLLWQKNDSGINLNDPLYLGDYNGDGKTDFLDPTTNGSYSFRTFLSTGTAFAIQTRTQPFKYVKTNWNGNNGVLSGYNLIPLDINGDGRTDIVEYNTTTYNFSTNGTQVIKIYNNKGMVDNSSPGQIKFTYGGTATKTGNLKHFPIPVYLTSDQPNKNLDFASISNKWVTNFSFTQDHREDVLLRSVNNNGIKHDIEYKNLDPSAMNSSYMQVYQTVSEEIYPYIDLNIAPGFRVVSMIERSSSTAGFNLTPTKKLYVYYGAVYNTDGLGFLGFKGVARSNWHTSNSDRIFTVSKHDVSLRGAVTNQYTLANYVTFYVPSSGYITKTTNQYSSSLSSNKMFKLWMNSSLTQNNIDGSYSNAMYQYDSYNNPTTITTSYLGGSSFESMTYSNNTGSTYYIGRPSTRVATSIIGGETFTSEQQYIYTGYLLTQKKLKGNGTPFDIENFQHDTFGNVTKKTIIPNGESPREIEFEYDISGRFLTKSIDIQDLETNYEYNTTNGNLTSITNPFSQQTIYEYDAWNRPIKSIDYLGKRYETSYTEDSNHFYSVLNQGEDGSESEVIYDPLMRISKVKEKNVLGQWTNISYEYDAIGRLYKKSEPYSGSSSPSQWNETTYDLYSRPVTHSLYTGRIINITYNGLSTTVNDGVKTVTSLRDGIGNTTSVTDPGGTINYTFYGNGNIKNSNYDGVVVSVEQDGWGRKTKLIDPSAGTYKYTYNGFGELITEISPKGTTDYTYSTTGQLLTKNISGDLTDMTINYGYHPTHKSLTSISVTSPNYGAATEYSYTYDSDIRLTQMVESSEFAKFEKKYTYDSFGRVNTEENYARLHVNGKSSTKKVKHEYQNGVLKTIKDFSTNNNIWNVTGANARGQLTSAELGHSIIQSNSYDAYGYLTHKLTSKDTGSTLQVAMQLTTDFDVQRGTLNSRTNSMFSWSETFGYDSLDRLVTFNDNNGNNSNTYDDYGRITFNNGVGDYNYSGTSYQVDNIELNNQGDLYYQQNTLEQIKYNAFKKPFEINEEGKEKISFHYNAFMGRSNMFYGDTESNLSNRNNRKHYSFDGSMEISYDDNLGKTTFVTYIGGDGYTAPAIWRSEQDGSGTDQQYLYLHRDYLGSILLITDENGDAKEKRHFDAWGNIVKLTDGNDIALDKLTLLDRGYTGHEHLQGVGLIHMNGRLYDPKLKRFLSPDHFIQDVSNTQNYNRYGYVLNNPLMYVDPSGETTEDPGGLSSGAQVGIGAALASAYAFLKDLDFRGFRNWVGRNFQSAVRDVSNFFRNIGRGVKKFFQKIFGGGKVAPVEYSNYEGLSNDPMAGPSTNIPTAFFGGGDSGSSNIGIEQELTPIEAMLKKAGYNYTYSGLVGASEASAMDMINKIPELKHMYEFHGKSPRIYVDPFGDQNYYSDKHFIQLGGDAFNRGFKGLAGTLFHESFHAFQEKSGFVMELRELFDFWKPNHKHSILEDVLEVQSYNYAWGLGGDRTEAGIIRYNFHKNNIMEYINTSNNQQRIDFLKSILNELKY
ncbi:RHS repeat-associated core domain-containing protein [uncultured Psychroserpens sp.]|uniref:RHS repeat-associated core domain-containing protein n=1 Tax=uncultured Psychroserpens sp. TaxID=255436 RepID=UPI00262D7E98|nr:RHS repeat-associated core domain-containing protein [uncultured Psychroserpens sp.]